MAKAKAKASARKRQERAAARKHEREEQKRQRRARDAEEQHFLNRDNQLNRKRRNITDQDWADRERRFIDRDVVVCHRTIDREDHGCGAEHPATVITYHPKRPKDTAWALLSTECPACGEAGFLSQPPITFNEWCDRLDGRWTSDEQAKGDGWERRLERRFWDFADGWDGMEIEGQRVVRPVRGHSPPVSDIGRAGHPATIAAQRQARERRQLTPDELDERREQRHYMALVRDHRSDGPGAAAIRRLAEIYAPQLQSVHGLHGEEHHAATVEYLYGAIGEMLRTFPGRVDTIGYHEWRDRSRLRVAG